MAIDAIWNRFGQEAIKLGDVITDVPVGSVLKSVLKNVSKIYEWIQAIFLSSLNNDELIKCCVYNI